MKEWTPGTGNRPSRPAPHGATCPSSPTGRGVGFRCRRFGVRLPGWTPVGSPVALTLRASSPALRLMKHRASGCRNHRRTSDGPVPWSLPSRGTTGDLGATQSCGTGSDVPVVAAARGPMRFPPAPMGRCTDTLRETVGWTGVQIPQRPRHLVVGPPSSGVTSCQSQHNTRP